MFARDLAVDLFHQLAVETRMAAEDLHHIGAAQLIDDRAADRTDGGEAPLTGQDAVFAEVLAFLHHVDLGAFAAQDLARSGLQKEHPVRLFVDPADVLSVAEFEAL